MASGQILGGTGTVNGAVTVDAGGTLQPSLSGPGISTLTFSNALTLSGNAIFNINRTNAQKADLVVVPSLVLGGSVTIQNVGATPVLGDTFQLFSVSGAISNAGYYPVLPSLGSGVHWDYSKLVTNGTITVASGAPTFFSVKTYGAKGDGVSNDWTPINNAIQAAIAAGPGSVVDIPDATYVVASGTFVLNNASGITVEGDTNTLLINTSVGDLIHVDKSSNVTIQNLMIDVQPLRFTQGTINSLSADGLVLTVTLEDGYPSLSAPIFSTAADNEVCFWTDPNFLAYDKNLTGNIFSNATQITSNHWTITLTSSVTPNVVGKEFAVWNDGGGWAMNLSGNTGQITVSNLVYYGGGSAPLLE